MSVQATTAVWEHSESTGSARLLLLAMANEASSDGLLVAYKRSQSHLAARAKIAERSVRRLRDQLVALGELEVIYEGTGRQSSDYRIVLPGLDPDPQVLAEARRRATERRQRDAEGGQDVRPQPGVEGGQDVRPGGTGCPPRGDTVSPPSSRSSRSHPRSAKAAAADAAAAPLPGMADPQPVGAAGDSDPVESVAWRLVRECHEARDRKPIESRKATQRVVRRLLVEGGWTVEQVREALMDAPAWTPSALQVQLQRGSPTAAGGRRRRRANEGWTRDGSNSGVWTPDGGIKR